MTVILYKTESDKRKLNKSLTILETLDNVNLLQNCSTPNPIFIFEGVLPINFNYLFAHEFNRYYFVEDVQILRGQLTQITCHVDVLMSFRDDILNTSCIVERAPSNNNVLLSDGQIPLQTNTTTVNKKLTGSEILASITPTNVSFLLNCYE